MIRGLLLCSICAGVWYFVKQAAITFDVLWLWDDAEIAAGIVGVIGMAYVQYPHVMHPFARTQDPIGSLVYRSLVFGTAVAMICLGLGVAAEEQDLIRTPERLAPPKARLLEKVITVDELDEATLERYTEGEMA